MKYLKKSTAIFIVVIQIASSLIINSFAATGIKKKNETSDLIKLQSSANSFIYSVDSELQKMSTNVIAELDELITKYNKLLLTANKIEAEKIKSLISTTNELINDYSSYSEATRGEFHILYSAEVAVAIAAFNALGYNLSAELLTHAKDNNILDSYYHPIFGSLVSVSSVFTNIKNGNFNSGSDSFPNSGSTNEKDLYFAIHSFNYRKSNSGRVVIIEDRYDFAQGAMGSSLTGMVVNEMYKAQEAGVLVPFYTHITEKTNNPIAHQSETVSINTVPLRRFFHKNVVLGNAEYKEFTMTFDTTGYRIFQTFGKLDTKIEIFNEQGILLSEEIGDDSGYGTNSLLRFHCVAGTKYKIRVSFHFDTSAGEFIFTVTPANGAVNSGSSSINSYEDIWTVTGYTAFTFDTWTVLNQTKLLTFTPTSTGDYTFEIISEYDTCMYVIDPRYCGVFDESLIYNDNDGEGLNPKIIRNLEVGIPYLVIYSALNIQNSGAIGNVSINIFKN